MKKIVNIFDYGFNGEGVAKDEDGRIIFVPYCLKNEQVEIEIQKEKTKFLSGKLKNIVISSKDRVCAPCPYFSVCGGCDLQHMQYEKQLELKTNIVKNTLKNVGKMDADVLPCVASKDQYHYRNKMVFPVKEVLGMFKQNSHEIVAIKECLLDTHFSKTVIDAFRDYCLLCNSKRANHLKYVMVRSANNQYLFTLVVSSRNLPNITPLVEKLSTTFKHFGLFLNINPKEMSEILSPNFVHLHGQKSISLQENGISYDIGPYSFMQVNHQIKNEIYSKVLSMISENETVVDAYSGAGLLSAQIAKKAKKVIAVEINEEASKYAELLMKKNNISNVENICGDCNVVLPKITKSLESFFLILDPPRSGCDKEIISTIMQTLPNKIIYISCNAATLARDIKNLESYQIDLVQPYDMFPQTKHIETLVCLTKRNS